MGKNGSRSAGTEKLTPPEHEVMHWVVRGKTRWEIGRIINRSEDAVKKRLGQIYAKLGVHTRADAIFVYLTGGQD